MTFVRSFFLRNGLEFIFHFCRHKAEYLKSLIQEQEIICHAAYGSSKDINVYSSLGLKSDKIFVIGKPSRRQSNLQCTWLTEGYAEHLARLTSPGGSRPAQGNARMVIPKGSGLGPPGLQRRRTFKSASRATSYPYGADGASGGAAGGGQQAGQSRDGKLMNSMHFLAGKILSKILSAVKLNFAIFLKSFFPFLARSPSERT